MRYRDGMGHVFIVPDEQVDVFERRRRVALIIAIVGKLAIIVALVWVFGL